MDETTDFNGEINLFKLNFDGSKLIYEYDSIPEDEKQEDFVKRGNEYFSLKKVIGHRVTEFRPSQIHKLIENAFKTALNNNFYEFNERYVAYKLDDKIPHMKSNDTLFSIYNGFEYRFVPFKENMFLCIDYKSIIKFNVSLQYLLDLNVSKSRLVGNSVEIKKSNRKNSNGVLVDIDSNFCKIDFHEFGIESINTSDVYILCRPEVIQLILNDIGQPENIIYILRQHSLINPKKRLIQIKSIVKHLSTEIFPLLVEDLKIALDREPLRLEKVGYSTSGDDSTLKLDTINEEPMLQFDKGSSLINRPLPTNYPPYTKVENVALNFYYPSSQENSISVLCDQINRYLRDYYYVRNCKIHKIPIDNEPMDLEYSQQILASLKFSNNLNVGVIYVPESMKYYKNSPYYKLKAYFASQGFPTQMITSKAFSPSKYSINYTVLNICSGIIAKCGGIPWVLGEKLNGTDLLIGTSLSSKLSYIGENIQNNRYIGFANVFNEYGKWMYFCGTAKRYYRNQLVEQLESLITEIRSYYSIAQQPLPKNIMIHNSNRFSNKNRIAIFDLLKKSFGEDVRACFVTIDESHNYRAFDFNSEDGSLSRRNFIYLSDRQFLLSTTGSSDLKGAFRLGTPKMLNVTVDQYPNKYLSLEDVAFQILALTKLNWAAPASPVQREPVTIKFANKLAKLSANMIPSQWEEASDRLFNKPWFI